MTYHVIVTREAGLWVADIAELTPGATDVERFADLDTEVRDLIAGLTGTELDAIEISWRYVIDGADVTEQLADLLETEEALRAVSAARDQLRGDVVETLRRTGVSQATIGDVLGLSHQRVHQLIKASA